MYYLGALELAISVHGFVAPALLKRFDQFRTEWEDGAVRVAAAPSQNLR